MDIQYLLFLQGIREATGGFFDEFFNALSKFAVDILPFLPYIIFWCVDKKWGYRFIAATWIGEVVNGIIKLSVCAYRPWIRSAEIEPAGDSQTAATGYSFPSGHSTNSTIAFGSIVYFFKNKALRIICIILPLAVGISRFCVGVHYPTDVIFGWAMGTCIVFLMPWLLKKFPNKKVLYPVIFVISCVGWFYCKTNDYYTGLGMMGGFFIADIFEEKYVRFENTRSAVSSVIRVIVGAGLFLGLNAALKLPFPARILEAENAVAYLIRTVRYAIVMFVEVGVYPMSFTLLKKLDKKPAKEE